MAWPEGSDSGRLFLFLSPFKVGRDLGVLFDPVGHQGLMRLAQAMVPVPFPRWPKPWSCCRRLWMQLSSMKPGAFCCRPGVAQSSPKICRPSKLRKGEEGLHHELCASQCRWARHWVIFVSVFRRAEAMHDHFVDAPRPVFFLLSHGGVKYAWHFAGSG